MKAFLVSLVEEIILDIVHETLFDTFFFRNIYRLRKPQSFTEVLAELLISIQVLTRPVATFMGNKRKGTTKDTFSNWKLRESVVYNLIPKRCTQDHKWLSTRKKLYLHMH